MLKKSTLFLQLHMAYSYNTHAHNKKDLNLNHSVYIVRSAHRDLLHRADHTFDYSIANLLTYYVIFNTQAQ